METVEAKLTGIPLQQPGQLSVVFGNMRPKTGEHARANEDPLADVIFQCDSVEPKKVIIHMEPVGK